MRPPADFVLLAITPPTELPSLAEIEAAAVAGAGELALLLRLPAAPAATLERHARDLLPICRDAGAKLLVHGDSRIAHHVGADGVHLPERRGSLGDAGDADVTRMRLSECSGQTRVAREDVGPSALVGVSRHDVAGLTAAAGADYATFSPVFTSPGKASPVGLAALAAAAAAAAVPVFALGGISAANASACREAGAAGVAAIRGVWDGDAASNVRGMLRAWNGHS